MTGRKGMTWLPAGSLGVFARPGGSIDLVVADMWGGRVGLELTPAQADKLIADLQRERAKRGDDGEDDDAAEGHVSRQ